MQLIHGSLSQNLDQYHQAGIAELAVVVIDEKHHWERHETSENAKLRRDAQQTILKKTKSLGCRTITVDFPRVDSSRKIVKDDSGNMIPCRESPHIEEIVGEPDFSFAKYKLGVLDNPDADRLLDYLDSQHIKNLLIMGGNVDVCVSKSIFGGDDSPGFLTSGKYNIVSTASVLSPYTPSKQPTKPESSLLNKHREKEIKGKLHFYTDI
ncbi:hypothetical protein GCM10023116_21100 [Kistimonas scapharcae]|uniref:Isochorismatase-like domain-containing protein n=1 Tax=Kistimonas scapharcae TaxID=1036133 RepID=A0ABP8V366_9GAMM